MSRSVAIRGFTLIELMVTLAILVVMASVAVPSYLQFTRNTQVQGKAEEVEALLRYARSQAVVTRKPYELVLDNDTWYVEPRDGGAIERQVEFNPAQTKPLSSDLTDNTMVFLPNGTVRQNGRITLCRDDDFEHGYSIEIKASGAIHLYQRGYLDASNKLTTCIP
ncbi:type II secretion system protein H [compost metagenome]